MQHQGITELTKQINTCRLNSDEWRTLSRRQGQTPKAEREVLICTNQGGMYKAVLLYVNGVPHQWEATSDKGTEMIPLHDVVYWKPFTVYTRKEDNKYKADYTVEDDEI